MNAGYHDFGCLLLNSNNRSDGDVEVQKCLGGFSRHTGKPLSNPTLRGQALPSWMVQNRSNLSRCKLWTSEVTLECVKVVKIAHKRCLL